eukprot:9351532-Heterocapsa_arctica.AAC.1
MTLATPARGAYVTGMPSDDVSNVFLEADDNADEDERSITTEVEDMLLGEIEAMDLQESDVIYIFGRAH